MKEKDLSDWNSEWNTDWNSDRNIESVLSDCTLCPRNCHVNRAQGQRGFCGEAGVVRAARAALYYTEEPVISGKRGSGTVFFAGCNLGCIYCQNRQISRPAEKQPLPLVQNSRSCAAEADSAFIKGTAGHSMPAEAGSRAGSGVCSRAGSGANFETGSGPDSTPSAPFTPVLRQITPERLSDIFFELEDQGAHNINLVTPEHFVPLLVPALRRAKKQGLSIPVVYNTGSYERVEAVRALEGLVDVWLPDLKYVSPALSARHTGAADYFQYASAAIAEMVRQCPEPVFSDGSHEIDCPDDADDPLLVRGVLVRHLALPGCGEDSRAVLRYLHETYGDRIFISIMNQYTPMPQVFSQAFPQALPQVFPQVLSRGSDSKGAGAQPAPDPDLCRRLSGEEYDALVDYAIEIGIENGFIQESGTVSPSYIPVFDGSGV